MSADVIKAEVPGSILKLDTPLGTVVPITFGTDGFMSGDAGTLGAVLGSPKDKGRWWVEGDRICYKWFRWFDAQPHCVAVERDGEKIFWKREDGETGTATLERHQSPKPVQVAKIEPVARVAAHPAISRPQPPALPVVSHKRDPEPILVKPPAPAVRPPKLITTHHEQVVAVAKPDHRVIPKADPEPTFRVAGVEPDDVLNVRRGPSEDEEIIGSLTSSTTGVTITGQCMETWCPVRRGGVEGWVNSYYLAGDSN